MCIRDRSNQASIAKLVWAVATKKDNLWVKWVHEKYLKTQDWWTYHPPPDCSWYWKKLIQIRDMFRGEDSIHQTWLREGYRVSQGYTWLQDAQTRPTWTTSVRQRTIIPRHTFTSLAFHHDRLLVCRRLAKFNTKQEMFCSLYPTELEDQEHVFFKCDWRRNSGHHFFNGGASPSTYRMNRVLTEL